MKLEIALLIIWTPSLTNAFRRGDVKDCTYEVVENINLFREDNQEIKMTPEKDFFRDVLVDLANAKDNDPTLDCKSYDQKLPPSFGYLILNECLELHEVSEYGPTILELAAHKLINLWTINMSQFYNYPGEAIGYGDGCQSSLPGTSKMKIQRHLTIFANMIEEMSCYCLDDKMSPTFFKVYMFCVLEQDYFKENRHKPTKESVFDYERFLKIQNTFMIPSKVCPTVSGFNAQIIGKINEIRGPGRHFDPGSVNPELDQLVEKVMFELTEDCEVNDKPSGSHSVAVFCLQASQEDRNNHIRVMNLGLREWLQDIHSFV